MQDLSEYIIFVDESGDHGLQKIDQNYPVFVLVFIIIKKSDYLNNIVPAFLSLKLKYWGHDHIILHENDIRKEKGYFSLLRKDSSLRSKFYEDLDEIVRNSNFEYISSIIKKDELNKKYVKPYNPYEIGLLFCMEQALNFLLSKGEKGKTVHLIIEARGNKEDKDLELEFRRICDNKVNWGYRSSDFSEISFELICVDKKCNSIGLQLADLIARPIGVNVLKPLQENRAIDGIKQKRYSQKIFP